MSLTDDQAVSEIVEGKDGLLSESTNGKIVIDMSTISPETSRKLAAKILANQGNMLDAPISGNPIMVKEGTATIMVGGDNTVFIRVKPILESISHKVFYVGENGHALFLKLTININLAAQFYAFCESLLLLKKAGLNIQNAIEIIKNSAIASPNIQQRASLILSPPEDSLFTIKMMQKDLLLALDQGHKQGTPLLNTALANEALTAANGLGYSEKDVSQLFQAMQQMLTKR
jgi:3-hydroxyisobutyrate dehydrogenase-like beta-hydroxyacid dehydrogenase